MTTNTLPPYTGPKTTCPKCGYFRASTVFKYGGIRCASNHEVLVQAHQESPGSEWLCRRCERCEYAWDEACLDTTEPAAAPEKPGSEPLVGSMTIINSSGSTPGIGGGLGGGPSMGGAAAAVAVLREDERVGRTKVRSW
jgi:hypothetical protein